MSDSEKWNALLKRALQKVEHRLRPSGLLQNKLTSVVMKLTYLYSKGLEHM